MSKSIHVYPELPETGFLRLPQVLRFIPVGRSTWWQGVKEGRFPKPVKLGPKTTVWKAEDINLLLKELGEDQKEGLK